MQVEAQASPWSCSFATVRLAAFGFGEGGGTLMHEGEDGVDDPGTSNLPDTVRVVAGRSRSPRGPRRSVPRSRQRAHSRVLPQGVDSGHAEISTATPMD